MSKQKKTTIDLFAGCGGLTDGFEKTNEYETVTCVEWKEAACETLSKRLKEKWGYSDADERVLRFDMRKTNKLLFGWENEEYGSNIGLENIVNEKADNIDLIIGGPPCQAYSIAGRIRDKNNMEDDYRNYLFESYVNIVNHFQPDALIFENVTGILSAKPGGVPVLDKIKESFNNVGYEIINNIRGNAVVDASEYGVPQKRKRVILVGLKKKSFKGDSQDILLEFYEKILPQYKEKQKTVRDVIADLPSFKPLPDKDFEERKKSHYPQETNVPNHSPRYHNQRDISIFKELAEDVLNGCKKYSSTEDLKEFYKRKTGKSSSVHKYHVLRWDEPSNTIVAHLKKDGLRHIHPDPEQARSLTIREAAKLQSFDDDFIFTGGQGDNYEMIGNAVPPLLAEKIARSILKLFKKYKK